MSHDRISELPDFILHQILSFLSAKEAVKACILSKRWHHIWETFPVLDCDQLFFGRYLDLLNPKEVGLPKDTRRNIFDQREKFLGFVDESLRRVYEKDVCLRRFGLVMSIVSLELLPRVDSWMEVVTGLSVQEVELRLTVGKGRFYALPIKVLTSQSLNILRLKGCSLIHCLQRMDLKLCSLVELHLQGCFIDDQSIQNLVSSVQSLEVMSVKDCSGFTKFEIQGHKKLKKIVYHSHRDLKVEAISLRELPNLEELEFWCVAKVKQRCKIIGGSTCPNLRRLSLAGFTIRAKSLQRRISSFRLLERLILGGCVVTGAVKISSSVLKELHIRNCTNMVGAEFDTPALQLFQYHGKDMPYLSLDNVPGSRIAELRVPLNDMDIFWFMKLNAFARENKFQDLVLSITAGWGDEIRVCAEDFTRTQRPQPFNLNSVRLVLHGSISTNNAALLDGLLWNLLPKTLSLELTYNSTDCMKGLLKSLVMEADPGCCCSKNVKCWRHSLKDIKLGIVKGFRTGTPLNSSSLGRLHILLDNWAIQAKRTVASYGTVKGEILSFDLLW